jgi:signal peptidase I
MANTAVHDSHAAADSTVEQATTDAGVEAELPSSTRRRTRFAVGLERVVTVVLCVMIIALAAMLAARAAGYKMLVVRSGSMTPTLRIGDVIITRAIRPNRVQPGDIVTFRDPALNNQLVTHRVVGTAMHANTVAFVTKGDANTAVEHWTISTHGTLGKEIVALPALGRILNTVPTPIALIILLTLLIAWGLYKALQQIWRNDSHRGPPAIDTARTNPDVSKRRGPRWRRLFGGALCAVCTCAGLSGSTRAAWSAPTNNPNTFTVATSFPTITNVALQNNSGGTAGLIEKGDQIVVTFSTVMKVASLCSAWSGDNTNQTLNSNGDVTITIHEGAGTTTHDSITIASATCTFNFGSVDLGTNAYISGGDATFNGSGGNKSTITWTVATHTLTITLGKQSGGTPATVASSTATYTASPSITDTTGGILTNTPYTLTNGQYF